MQGGERWPPMRGVVRHAWRFRVTVYHPAGRSVSPGPRGDNMLALDQDPPQRLSKANSKTKIHHGSGNGSLSRNSQRTLTVSIVHRGDKEAKPGRFDPVQVTPKHPSPLSL